MLKDMCQEAGIEGHKTNHSLRETGSQELFEAGVPKIIIEKRTGNTFLAARVCKRTTTEQQQVISAVLHAEKNTSFEEAMQCYS